jgi:hypothetical protein
LNPHPQLEGDLKLETKNNKRKGEERFWENVCKLILGRNKDNLNGLCSNSLM